MRGKSIKPKSVIRISLCRTAKRNPNDRFGFNAKIKAFRASLRGIVDEKFFLYRLAKIYAYPH